MTRPGETAAPRRPAWSNEGRELRPYAVTGGRTMPKHEMRLTSQLRARRGAPPGRTPEEEQALALCREATQSVAEIAAGIAQPVQVTKIILSDLIEAGSLVVALSRVDPADPELLGKVLHLLRKKWQDVG